MARHQSCSPMVSGCLLPAYLTTIGNSATACKLGKGSWGEWIYFPSMENMLIEPGCLSFRMPVSLYALASMEQSAPCPVYERDSRKTLKMTGCATSSGSTNKSNFSYFGTSDGSISIDGGLKYRSSIRARRPSLTTPRKVPIVAEP